jgi:hypothetical protein
MNYDNCEHEYMELKSEFEAESRFDDFIDEINEKVTEILGLTIDDFPDFDFYSAYEEGVNPESDEWKNMIKSALRDYISQVGNF